MDQVERNAPPTPQSRLGKNPLPVTGKEMPEYPMDAHELVYPGEGSPFPVTGPDEGPTGGPHHRGTPDHPAVPTTEVPRQKVHYGAAETAALLQQLVLCITHCERCATICRTMQEKHKYADCITNCKACADICVLLHSYISSIHLDGLGRMAMDLSPVCARVCEACALECRKHPGMAACVDCEQACANCAKACRAFAR